MEKPPFRRLWVYTFDPSLSTRLDTALVNRTILRVPWEDLRPGPSGDYVEVVDYDPASERFYRPIDLSDPHLLAQDGLAPSEGNPKFHQQMVYAVAMTTIANFEAALGRKALWGPHLRRDPDNNEVEKSEPVLTLKIYPHALREANAYYSPEKKAILFGYFPASAADPENLPGGLVFTCLSHDVIAHETTHALLHGIHRYFAEPSNPDVLAFHEAFADIVALFQHFTQIEALRHQIAKTRGDLAGQENLMGSLASQFGHAIGNHGALRDFIGKVDPATGIWTARKPSTLDYPSTSEPHERGGVLVAALFDAFLSIYKARTADLLRIASSGSGVLPEGQIHPDLVDRLAGEAAKTAAHFLRMAIRALDYCPPVDITFGDYLRALITGDADLVPDDPHGYRVAIIEAFRRRGIYPRDVRVLGEDALRWDRPPRGCLPSFAGLIKALKDPRNVPEAIRSVPEAPELPTLEWQTTGSRKGIEERTDRYRMLTWLWMNDMLGQHARGMHPPDVFAAEMGLALGPDAPHTIFRSKKVYRGKREKLPTLEIHSVRVSRRGQAGGLPKTDLVIEMTQRRRGYFDPARQAEAEGVPADSPRFDPPTRRRDDGADAEEGSPGGDLQPDFLFRGGCTLLIDGETGEVRYCIGKGITSESRLARQRAFAADGAVPSLRATYDPHASNAAAREPFAMLHRAF